MSYLIKKDQKTNTITYMDYDLKGYKFTPKSKKSEIDRLKSIIINKYKNYISYQKEKMFLENLAYLENQIQMKMMIAYNFYQTPEMEEEQTQGRGR